MKRLQLLQSSWTQVARDYKRIFVPRFQPWVDDAIQALVDQKPPEGCVFVGGCGTGDEIISLTNRLPSHTFVGVDLAEGMVEVAREALQAQLSHSSRVQLLVGDASVIPPEVHPVAAVVSCFVLQQMARPRDVLATWTASLRPGGVLTVLFWPRAVEKEGPWRRLMDLTQAAAGGKPAEDWEAGLLQSAEEAGGVVVCDARISHSMEWESVDAFWEGMTRAGPWHSRRLQYGDEHMEELRAAFLQGYGPDGGRQPLQHAPEARLIVLRRQRGAAL